MSQLRRRGKTNIEEKKRTLELLLERDTILRRALQMIISKKKIQNEVPKKKKKKKKKNGTYLKPNILHCNSIQKIAFFTKEIDKRQPRDCFITNSL